MNDEQNIIPPSCEGAETADAEMIADTESVSPKRRITTLLSRIAAPFDGMYHIGIAFFFPIMIMVLIYIAMEVWPFGKNSVLVLDLNGQYVYYFEALRDILHGEQGFLYSFERALGGEFLGIIAYYLASPFSVLVALFPEGMITESIYTILLLKCGLSGMNMCVYLHKSHPTNSASEVIFSVLYALCSYSVVMQHNTMWFDCVLFFPLILLGVESLIKYGKYKLYVITLAVAVFSNYYIGYMVCIGVAAYFFFYYTMLTAKERNPMAESFHFLKTFGRMILFSAIAVGIASLIIFPAYYSLTFGKTTFSDPKFNFDQKFDFLDLISKMYPGSYDTVRPEGWPTIYSGVLTLILLPVFFLIKQITPRQKIAYGALMAFFIFSFNSTTIDLVWHGFQRPNWLNYRYSFMFCFVIIVIAYKAFEHITEMDFRIVLGVGAALGLVICILQKLEYENIPDLMSVWFSIGCIAVYMIMLSGCNKRWLDGAISSILCVFVLLELFCNGLSDVIALDNDVSYSSRTSYLNFINKWTPAADYVNEIDTSFYRAEKTEHRKTNDNFTLNLKGLSNSTSTLNEKQIEFLKRMGYSSKSHWSKYLGGTPVADSLLGVKYLLTTDETEMNDVYGEPIFYDEENKTQVYQNNYALPLGYMVSSLICDVELGEMVSPFERMNEMVGAMLGSDEPVELFRAYKNVKPSLENVELSYVTGHKMYSKSNTSRTGKLLYTFTPVNDGEIFVYFPSDYPRDATLKVNGIEVSEYFTNETCRIVSIGKQPAGEELLISLNLDDDEVYIANNNDPFYYLDEELFCEIMPQLQANGFEIESFTDDHFIGRVNATEEKLLFLLTIPFDEGWNIYVDGEKTQGFEVLESLTAVELSAGEHEIELRYMSAFVEYGVKVSLSSLTLFLLIIIGEYFYRKKREKITFQAE